MDEKHPTPGLTMIFYILGTLNLFATLLAFVAGMDGLSSSASSLAGFIPFIGFLGSAVFCFGVGQLINYIALIAHNSGRILVELRGGAEREKEILSMVHNVALNTAKAVHVPATQPAQKPVPSLPPGVKSGSRPARYFFVGINGDAEGPVSIQELKKFVSDDLVSTDTQVCAEGTDKWMPLTAVVQL